MCRRRSSPGCGYAVDERGQIRQLERAISKDEDVGRLEVAMDDRLWCARVQVVHRDCDLPRPVHCQVVRDVTRPDRLLEAALGQFHHQKTVRWLGVGDDALHDVTVAHAGQQLDLSPARDRPELLDGYRLPVMEPLVDDAKPALAENLSKREVGGRVGLGSCARRSFA